MSQAVCEGGAAKARPMGTNATASMEELIGFSSDPRIIGAIRRRSKPLGSALRGRPLREVQRVNVLAERFQGRPEQKRRGHAYDGGVGEHLALEPAPVLDLGVRQHQ